MVPLSSTTPGERDRRTGWHPAPAGGVLEGAPSCVAGHVVEQRPLHQRGGLLTVFFRLMCTYYRGRISRLYLTLDQILTPEGDHPCKGLQHVTNLCHTRLASACVTPELEDCAPNASARHPQT